MSVYFEHFIRLSVINFISKGNQMIQIKCFRHGFRNSKIEYQLRIYTEPKKMMVFSFIL